MKIERFEVPGLAQFSYVVSSQGKAVVVDSIRDIDRYLEYAEAEGLTITHVLETHIHADFAAGSVALAEATGAELALSAYDEGEHYRYAMPHRELWDRDSVLVGKVRIEALHTPGHTPEHLSFLLFDEAQSGGEPAALLSGDFLFAGTVGRPDLLGEEAKLGLARELYRSLRERIGKLPDALQVYPGHGAGSLCGAGMSERAETTLGYERETNVLFRLHEAAFVEEVLASVPPMPMYYPRMKALNAVGAASVATLPGERRLGLAEAAWLVGQEDVIVLDVRRPDVFGAGHVMGAVNIGVEGNISMWAGWLLDPAKRIVLVGDGGSEESARRALVRVGLDRIEGTLEGGMAAWIDAGMEVARTRQVSVLDVNGLVKDGAVVLDVRTDAEWAGGGIAGARHIALGDLEARVGELNRDSAWIAVCGTGYRSSVAASLLARLGFKDVSSMTGGMGAWEQQGLAVADVGAVAC